MSALATTDQGRELSPRDRFRNELDRMGEQFAAALPSHIKPEKFQRVVMTAVLSDPNILSADRKSLMESAIRAAQDGLLPDKREGAFVVFKGKVQWMPMIGGVIKRIHQSGEVAMITAKVVFGGDSFRSWIDDEGEHLAYEQAELPDYGHIRQVFAMAKMKDGSIYVETLTPRDIEKIRSVSRSRDSGPWATWWEEMAKKSAIRRLSKRLPLSTDLHDLIARDDAMYDLSRAPDARPSLQDRLTAGRQASLTDAREGFNRDQATVETVEEPDNETLDEDEIEDAEEEAAEGTEADEGFPGDTAAEEQPDESTQPAPAAVANLLAEAASKLLEIATNDLDGKARQDAIATASAFWKKEIPEDHHPALKKIVTRSNDVILGKSNLAAAVALIAAEIGVKEADVRPAARR
ncbi:MULTISPECIES: recombinase RecT [unclassified Aureimonas]|uniref:recombinase RecT n=1 Tax=unclassified Aureimonas TaxID=2615206 RepID=UPI0006F33031|nr:MULTISPECIES: recombinase RecT [unclassified Aureimonas]KQT52177.1 hypothetical protein ASG62_16090 [Aureimonas sp. Leaf427]KQT70590.1 hypothetical protein ASG54_21860 [Aureimonas sp. Leaf460]